MSLFAKRSTATTLEGLKAEWAACQQCPFYTQRKHVVMGVGKIGAIIFAVGEAPADEEDEAGEPFVGRGGIATKNQFALADIPTTEVFWTNVLACRRFDWMTGVRQEFAQNCFDRLEAELLIVKPKMIVAMGSPAAQRFLPAGAKKSHGEMRGRSFVYRGLPGITIINPAAILRKPMPGKKQTYLEDIKVDLAKVRQMFEDVKYGRAPSPSSTSSSPV